MSRLVNTGFNNNHEFIARAHKRIDDLRGSLIRRGTWNASINVPVLGNNGEGGQKGDYYVVGTTGSTNLDGVVMWFAGDWIVNSGTKWEKSINSSGGTVSSVNAQTGDVVITAASIGLGNVSNESPAQILDDSVLTGNTTLENVIYGTQSYTGGGTHVLSVDGLATNIFDDTSNVTLPTTPTDGLEYTLINSGAGTITINSSGGDVIGTLGTSLSLVATGETITLRYISGVWYII